MIDGRDAIILSEEDGQALVDLTRWVVTGQTKEAIERFPRGYQVMQDIERAIWSRHE